MLREDERYARRHPAAPVLRYECIAYRLRAHTDPPLVIGQPFLARVDFAGHRYAWCEYVPVGGEGTHLASTFDAPPDPACARR